MTERDERSRVTALVRWFRRHSRDLPWRRERSAYGTLVSEAMLQQTQVARVVERYEQFLERFPTLEALAGADEQAVLAAWRGLGYYRRAQNLHTAARMIVGEMGGAVPADPDALRRLPGVGRYTAGAIASLAFDRPAPIVDGNVQRVLSRWHGRDDAPSDRSNLGFCWEQAQRLVEIAPDPAAVNEALMELGATVCTPAAPQCDACPVRGHCVAHAQGRQHEIPPARRAAVRQSVHHHAVVIVRAGRILLEQRPSEGLWSNMWQAPTVEARRALRPAELKRGLNVTLASLSRKTTTFVHQTTHRHITFHVYRGMTRARSGTWRDLDDLDEVPMSNAQRRVVAILETPKRRNAETPK